jgi:hypothetical protein
LALLYLREFFIFKINVQVSQAVLLDNFVQATARIEDRDRLERLRLRRLATRLENPLDPLLEQLARDHVDDADLSARIAMIFQVAFIFAANRGSLVKKIRSRMHYSNLI